MGALFRFEPKDIADIWVIARNTTFCWTQVLEEAKTKEGGAEADILYNIIRSFPKITHNNRLLAIIIPNKFEEQGIRCRSDSAGRCYGQRKLTGLELT